MTMTFSYTDARGPARICLAMEPGIGTPVLFVLNAQYPCGSVLAHYSGALALHRGIAGGAPWYMFDWRGSGKSTRPPGPISFSDLVDDVEAVADAIGEPLDINGVNDGCTMALAFAARRPEMVRRMLLVSPQGAVPPSSGMAEGARRVAKADPVMALTQYLMWIHPRTDPTETHQVAEEAFVTKSVELGRALRRAAISVAPLDLAASVRAPSLLLGAGDEMGDGMTTGLRLASEMPNARAMNWLQIGDGTINGPAWRKAWDETFPPEERLPSSALERVMRTSAGLSPRETEILALVCRGLSNSEVAVALVIAPSTAKRHVTNIFAKMGVTNRPQAIALAHDLGIVPASDAAQRHH